MSRVKAKMLKSFGVTKGVITNKQAANNEKRLFIAYEVNKLPYTSGSTVTAATYHQYNIGDKIEVFYNPANPTQALLREDMEMIGLLKKE